MKLFEHEGKKLFDEVGIRVPQSRLVSSVDELEKLGLKFPVVAKAQVLSGKRGKRGLVKVYKSKNGLKKFVESHLGSEVDGEVVKEFLVEEAVDIQKELYVSITYSTKSRSPVLLYSVDGGVEVEGEANIEEIPLKMGMNVPGLKNVEYGIENIDEKELEKLEAKIADVVEKLWQLFQEKDLFLAEINPLVITVDLDVYALDSKIVTDEAADFRQNWELPERNMLGTAKSWAEKEAEQIDKEDHRGVVGRVYLDLPGDIGVIAAGGGASLVAMDAMVGYGLKPANYTEFSGNPPKEKVKKLTQVVLAKKGLKGAILVGGKANFTDQVVTLSGFLEALEEIDPKYPIVVRRDGPRMHEAKKMLEVAAKKNGWNMTVFDESTPIIEAVKELQTKVNDGEKN